MPRPAPAAGHSFPDRGNTGSPCLRRLDRLKSGLPRATDMLVTQQGTGHNGFSCHFLGFHAQWRKFNSFSCFLNHLFCTCSVWIGLWISMLASKERLVIKAL